VPQTRNCPIQKPKRTRSVHERLGNKPCGQKGHPGETLRQSATPDQIIGHYPASCSGCGVALTSEMSRSHVARQVFDLPEPQPSGSPNIAPMPIPTPPAAPGREQRFPPMLTRQYSTVAGFQPSPVICCMRSSCRRSACDADGRPVRGQAHRRHNRTYEPVLGSGSNGTESAFPVSSATIIGSTTAFNP
jgi:hypothetical protein